MTTVKDDPEQIRQTMATNRQRIARAFRDEIAAIQVELSDDDIDAMVRGDVPSDSSDIRKTIEAILLAYLLAGRRVMATIEEQVPDRLAFDQAGYRVVAGAQQVRDRIETYYRTQQARATMLAVEDGRTRGISDAEMRVAARQSLGLTFVQVTALISYRKTLGALGPSRANAAIQSIAGLAANATGRSSHDPAHSAAIRQAVAAVKPLGAKQIDRMVAAHAARQVNARSRSIGETESTRATNEGATEAWDQAAEAGAVPPSSSGGASPGIGSNSRGRLDEYWKTADDELVRRSHVRLANTIRPDSGSWQGLYGALRYPCDPACGDLRDVAGCRCFIRREATF